MRNIFITTDIGGHDPDDQQSFIHLLHYYNEFKLAGVCVGIPKGRVEAIDEILSAARRDGHTYGGIRQVIHEGAEKKGVGKLNKGARALIEAAHSMTDQRLFVLCWGAFTDLAVALKHDPSIKPKIACFLLGDWNRDQDIDSYNFIKQQRNLTWVSCMTTFRGFYLGAPRFGKYSNAGFVRRVILPSGHLGEHFYKISKNINTGRYSIKMGDTPSFLWALKCDPANLGASSWGGAYRRVPGENHWFDSPAPIASLGGIAGARTVARHRRDYLDDWERKIEEYKEGK